MLLIWTWTTRSLLVWEAHSISVESLGHDLTLTGDMRTRVV